MPCGRTCDGTLVSGNRIPQFYRLVVIWSGRAIGNVFREDGGIRSLSHVQKKLAALQMVASARGLFSCSALRESW